MALEPLPQDALELKMSISLDALPPCPFCGGGRLLMTSGVNHFPAVGNGALYQSVISCTDHWCTARVIRNCRTREDAQNGVIDAWSRRARGDVKG